MYSFSFLIAKSTGGKQASKQAKEQLGLKSNKQASKVGITYYPSMNDRNST